MTERCKDCGANLAMVGRVHRCAGSNPAVPAKSKGLRIEGMPRAEPMGEGIALTSMAHPPGLIDAMADAIRSGKLSLKRGRPRITEPRPWEKEGISKRTYYRRQAKSKGEME